MSLEIMPLTNHSVLTQIEMLNKDIPCIKEKLFNWVVEMDKFEFNRLCCEITSAYDFWGKYQGRRVSDEAEILRPFIEKLPRVEIIIRQGQFEYEQKRFYQWLEETNVFIIQDICIELETLWDQALENINSYVIDSIFPEVQHECDWWTLDCGKPDHLKEVQQMLVSCRTTNAVQSNKVYF